MGNRTEKRTADAPFFLTMKTCGRKWKCGNCYRVFSKIMGNLTQETIVNLYEEVSVNEKITLIQELLDEKGEFAFTDILINPESIMEIVCAFLAILESVKMKMILVYQNRLFGDILIRALNYKEELNNHDPEQGAVNN